MSGQRRGSDVLEVVGSGILTWKGLPSYGSQDLGYTPGGVQDRFSYHTGAILLGTDGAGDPALEIISPPRAVRFRQDCWFVLTGGRLEAELTVGQEAEPVAHAVVYLAPAGSELRFKRRRYGFRTYLCCRAVDATTIDPTGRARGAYHTAARWPDPAGSIRVLPGPEYSFLTNPDAVFENRWIVSGDMNDMGIRLEAASEQIVPARRDQLISAPVTDGTVQMTPSGLIVLLRDRQTTGGYPRILVVVSADVDILAQIGPGRTLRFLRVTLGEALNINKQWNADLKKLRTAREH